MRRFIARGIVPPSGSEGFGLGVDNGDELRQWWEKEKIETRLDVGRSGRPLLSVGGKSFIDACVPGDEVEYTIEPELRSNGRRGIRGVDLKVVKRRSG